MIIKRDWTSFKAYLSSKGEFPQMFEFSDKYELFYASGGLTFQCIVFKSTPEEADQLDFETNFKPYCNRPATINVNPFNSKILPGNKKIYTRLHGISASVQGAPDTIIFSVPYNICKIMGIDIVGAHLGDKVNFKVLDTPTGTLSGVPNQLLNQFGTNVNICPDCYEYRSTYDADLIKDMQLVIEYDAIDELTPRNVYINFILHEIV